MPDKNRKNNLFSKLTGYYKNPKDGKGVKKRKVTDKEKYSLKSFFVVYKMRFWNLIVLNLIFMLMISPAICGVLGYVGVFHTRELSPTNLLFAPVYGAHLCSPAPATANLLSVFGTQTVVSTENAVTYTMYAIAFLVLLTFGPANVGMTYILRGYTRGDYVMPFRDFFSAIKKNFLSSIALGICDLLLSAALIFSTWYYYTASPDFSYTILFFVMFAMSFIYFMMRFYMYIMLITFKLTPAKLIKNSFILAILGIKRNIVAVVGIIVFALLFVVIFMFSVPFGITLPLFVVAANMGFMACFAAYANIKKYMIDPYYDEQSEKSGKGGADDKYDLTIEEEPIFVDRG